MTFISSQSFYKIIHLRVSLTVSETILLHSCFSYIYNIASAIIGNVAATSALTSITLLKMVSFWLLCLIPNWIWILCSILIGQGISFPDKFPNYNTDVWHDQKTISDINLVYNLISMEIIDVRGIFTLTYSIVLLTFFFCQSRIVQREGLIFIDWVHLSICLLITFQIEYNNRACTKHQKGQMRLSSACLARAVILWYRLGIDTGSDLLFQCLHLHIGGLFNPIVCACSEDNGRGRWEFLREKERMYLEREIFILILMRFLDCWAWLIVLQCFAFWRFAKILYFWTCSCYFVCDFSWKLVDGANERY